MIKRKGVQNRFETQANTNSLSAIVQSYYDLQKLRIASTNRLSGNVPEDTQETVDTHANIDSSASDEAQRSTGNQVIRGLSAIAELLKKAEKEHFKIVRQEARLDPMYDWLISQRGIGDVLAAGIISIVRRHKWKSVSSLWKYCGLDVQNGKAPKKKRGERIMFSPWCRMFLIGRVGESFIKCRSPWKKIYDEEKSRLQSKNETRICLEAGTKKDEGIHKASVTQVPCDSPPIKSGRGQEIRENQSSAALPHSVESGRGQKTIETHHTKALTPIHIHNRARRKMVKEFLKEVFARKEA